eukprot:COSAG01_NODE_6698_length_3539_cov_1.883721_1_plen_50_part_00
MRSSSAKGIARRGRSRRSSGWGMAAPECGVERVGAGGAVELQPRQGGHA